MKSAIPEWEVLPPEEPASAASSAHLEPLFRWLAFFMDDLLRLPGTKLRFGLDPIIGLIPGIGDTSSALVSALVLIQSARRGLPRILIARMAVNILINEIVGIVPVVGDAFSFWFKSNARNYALLQTHLHAPRVSTRADWIFVIAVLGVLLVVIVTGFVVSVLVLQALVKLLGFTR